MDRFDIDKQPRRRDGTGCRAPLVPVVCEKRATACGLRDGKREGSAAAAAAAKSIAEGATKIGRRRRRRRRRRRAVGSIGGAGRIDVANEGGRREGSSGETGQSRADGSDRHTDRQLLPGSRGLRTGETRERTSWARAPREVRRDLAWPGGWEEEEREVGSR